MSARRFYRHIPTSRRFHYFQVAVKETDLWIGVPCDCFEASMLERTEALIWRQRCLLENYLQRDPGFALSLEPYLIDNRHAPEIALAMTRAANRAGVGPMAAVAGAFAEIVGASLLPFCPEVIVENGGDLYIKVVEPVRVAIYADKSPLSGKLALVVEPGQTPLGICTSSGTVGPSFSRGRADAAVVLSPSAPLADAAATALGNLVHSPADLEAAVERARTINGVTGALLICKDRLAAWGEVKLQPLKALRHITS